MKFCGRRYVTFAILFMAVASQDIHKLIICEKSCWQNEETFKLLICTVCAVFEDYNRIVKDPGPLITQVRIQETNPLVL